MSPPSVTDVDHAVDEFITIVAGLDLMSETAATVVDCDDACRKFRIGAILNVNASPVRIINSEGDHPEEFRRQQNVRRRASS